MLHAVITARKKIKKHGRKRPLGRFRYRWADSIAMDLKGENI